jgi:hypothetical protein
MITFFAVGEETRGLDHDLGAQFLPGQPGRISLTEHLYLLAVEADRVVRMLDLPWKRAERGVVFREVSEGGRVGDVVDGDEVDVEPLFPGRSEQIPPDAAEAVDTDRYRNGDPPPWKGLCERPGLSARAGSNLSARAQQRLSRR